jgi:hypothetical protein
MYYYKALNGPLMENFPMDGTMTETTKNRRMINENKKRDCLEIDIKNESGKNEADLTYNRIEYLASN